MQTYYIYSPFVPEVVTLKRGTHWKCFMFFPPPNQHRRRGYRVNGVYYTHIPKVFGMKFRIQKKIYAFISMFAMMMFIIWKNPIEYRNTRPRKIGCPMKICAVGVPVCAMWACMPVSFITFSYIHLLFLSNIVDFCHIINSFLGNTFSRYFAVKSSNNNNYLFGAVECLLFLCIIRQVFANIVPF